MQPLCTHVNTLVISNFQICFPAPYLSLHTKYIAICRTCPEAELAPVSPTLALYQTLTSTISKDYTFQLSEFYFTKPYAYAYLVYVKKGSQKKKSLTIFRPRYLQMLTLDLSD